MIHPHRVERPAFPSPACCELEVWKGQPLENYLALGKYAWGWRLPIIHRGQGASQALRGFLSQNISLARKAMVSHPLWSNTSGNPPNSHIKMHTNDEETAFEVCVGQNRPLQGMPCSPHRREEGSLAQPKTGKATALHPHLRPVP